MKDFAFYFINRVLNKVPSRKFRMAFYYILSKGNINFYSSIGLGVTILDIRNIYIGRNSNINFDSLLDGRGAKILIGENVDIAPFCKIWTLEHDPHDNNYSSISGEVIISNNVWLGGSAIILPNTHIKEFSIIGAGSIFKGNSEEKSVYLGTKATNRGVRKINNSYSLPKIRRFR